MSGRSVSGFAVTLGRESCATGTYDDAPAHMGRVISDEFCVGGVNFCEARSD
jgi:hypothetical protein